MNLTHRPITPKTGKPYRSAAHLKRVRALDCVACGKRGPSEAHHCAHDRYSQRKSGDDKAIPLCSECHWEMTNRKAQWRKKHGADYDFLPLVNKMLNDKQDDDILGDWF